MDVFCSLHVNGQEIEMVVIIASNQFVVFTFSFSPQVLYNPVK